MINIKLIAISDDMTECHPMRMKTFMKKGWVTWVDLRRWNSTIKRGSDIIILEDNRYRINFKLKAFERCTKGNFLIEFEP
tara:strand:- start:6025 stop:6264 length:240 start_codon:yes stop_codon:yes gene_type:complete